MITHALPGFTDGLLGFGCMRFPTDEAGKIDREQAYAMLDLAYEHGVTYYDTAFPYHNQESETVLGHWLRGKPRGTVHAATKLPVWLLHSAGEARKIMQTQLERLQTDYVDYYLLHNLNDANWKRVNELGLLSLLDAWRAEGKIRHVGFSFHGGYLLFETVLRAYPWDFCQLQLNYLDTQVQAGLRGYELAASKQLPVVVMEPVKGGKLARVPQTVEQRFRALHPDWSYASWALRWAASLSGVAVVLSGMSTPEQVRDNLDTFARPDLSAVDRDAIAFAKREIAARQKVPCTGCEYCCPCPAGVDIPGVFRLYNNAFMFDEQTQSRAHYAAMDAEERAAGCIGCGRCVGLCPQQIGIPCVLRAAHAALLENC